MSEALAWAAGLFDGEGHARCQRYKNGRQYQLSLVVGQRHTEVLDRFQEAVEIGKIYSSPSKPVHRYCVYTFEKVQYVVVQLWPWLGSVKRDQITQAFNLYYQGKGLR